MDQASQQFSNLINKTANPEHLTITDAPMDRSSINAVDAANAAKRGPEPDWKSELEDLQRMLFGADTEVQAKEKAKTITAEHNRVVSDIEHQIKFLRESLKTPFLSTHAGFDINKAPLITPKGGKCGCDSCLIVEKIGRYLDTLVVAKEQREKAIRRAGAAIQSSRERDKLRPRFRELCQREAGIEAARSQTASIEDGTFRPEKISNADERRLSGSIKTHNLPW
jgi:hypothetical protein